MANINLKELQFRNFSGGLNTRDNPSEIGPNEIPDAYNVTIDERGSLQKRLGYTSRHTAFGSGTGSNAFYWAAQNKFVYQVGAGMHLDNAAAFLTWSTSDRCDITEFLGNLVMVHPVDGMRVYDGASVTTPTGSVAGNAIATWQNRLWVAQVNLPRVWYSDIASTTLSGTNYIDLREKDSKEIICMTGAAGLDVSGRPGLLCFKEDSAYRIYDSNTGAYNTIDPTHGAGSQISSVTINGITWVINTDGIYSTDGLEPLTLKSAKIDNLFDDNQINAGAAHLMAAGRHHNRIFFSLPRAGDALNTLALEVDPVGGWIMAHSNAASAYATKGGESEEMVFLSPSVDGQVYNFNVSGGDAGSDITSRFQTNWMELNHGNKARVRRMRFVGLGAFQATMLEDFQVSQSGRTLEVDISSGAGVYDDGDLYDDGVLYGPTKFQDKQDFYSLGVARQISMKITETSQATQVGRDIIGESGENRGGWTLAYISVLAVDLGFT